MWLPFNYRHQENKARIQGYIPFEVTTVCTCTCMLDLGMKSGHLHVVISVVFGLKASEGILAALPLVTRTYL